jgi:hypothetical protein
MRSPIPFLFAGNYLRDALAQRLEQARKTVAGLSPESMLQRSLAELAAATVTEHRVEPIELAVGDITQEKSERVAQTTGAPETTISFYIPFRGEQDLFKFRASTFSTMSPVGEVRDGEVAIRFSGYSPNASQVKSWLAGAIEQLEQFVSWTNDDVAAFNGQLENVVTAALEARLAKVRADEDLVAELAIPLRRRDDAPRTYVAPEVRRKPPSRPVPTTRNEPERREPVMMVDDYEHILRVVQNMVHVIELSPAAFAGMGEEDLRHHFLVQLNGQYEGQATGETFNFEGKTDILVRVEGRNVFIAECKFWNGPQALLATVDQILGYTSWRDTKAAIFLFNRNRRLTTILEKLPEVMSGHPNFVREVTYDGETGFRFVVRHKDDPRRELTLTVLVFETPA